MERRPDSLKKTEKETIFLIRVDIRSKLASARFLYAIAYSACCKGLAFHRFCLLMSELMFGGVSLAGSKLFWSEHDQTHTKNSEGIIFSRSEPTSARNLPVPVVSAQSRNEHARPAFFQYFVAAEVLPRFCEQALLVEAGLDS